jgi:VPS28 protein
MQSKSQSRRSSAARHANNASPQPPKHAKKSRLCESQKGGTWPRTCQHGRRRMRLRPPQSHRSSRHRYPSTRYPQRVEVSNGKEVKLHNGTPAQRRVWDDLATIYSIIVSLEFVEKAYVRDTITQAQYPSPSPGRSCVSGELTSEIYAKMFEFIDAVQGDFEGRGSPGTVWRFREFSARV